MRRLLWLLVPALTLAACASDGPPSGDDLKYGAFDVCTKFVKDDLKSPSSAKFRNYFQDDGEVSVVAEPDGRYVVKSTVDSQNSFGAMLRTGFSCSVTQSGDRWKLLSLSYDKN